MASRTTYNRNRPWCARVRLLGITYQLGYYRSREEAEAVENRFRWALRHITAEAHHMWRKQYNFYMSVARVRDNAGG